MEKSSRFAISMRWDKDVRDQQPSKRALLLDIQLNAFFLALPSRV